ncbi:MAG: methyl-accepting chemotaxis protein [Acetobacteraceae bacterium]|jgi:methyl-accepting chemotaxis protein
MQGWQHLTIATKVVAAFALVFVTTVGLGLFGLSQTAAVNSKAADIRDNWLPSTTALGKLVSAVRESRVREARVAISAGASDKSDLASDLSAFQTAQSEAEKAYANYQPLITAGTDDERLMRTYADAWIKLKASNAQVGDLAKRHDLDAMSRLYDGEDRANYDVAVNAIVADMDFNAAQGKIAAQEGEATYGSARLWTIGALALCGLLCIGAGLAIVRSVAGPLRLITAAVNRLATGDLEAAVAGADRADEIGMLARGLDVFKRNAVEARQLAGEKEATQANRERRAAQLDVLLRGFEAKVGGLVSQLASGSTELEATARSMSGTATRTNQQASAVASAAEEASTGVQTVASAADELTASIQEISRQVAQSAKITDKAVADAQRTDGIVRALSEGAEKIGQVVGLISDIAGQTNLLALNATIEAARAGDAGKGFAVVASEVKNLATQTAKATGEIGTQISQIQTATKEAVEAIRDIAATITEVSTIAASIASAVEEQGAATAEIARNVQETAQATQEVTANISGVSQSANETGAGASQVLSAAGDLSKQSEQLSGEVNTFVAAVRAA